MARDHTAPDRLVAARLDAALADLMSGTGNRYALARDHVAALMRFPCGGPRWGAHRAEATPHGLRLEVGDTRPALVVAEAEFSRFTEGAAMLVAATPLTTGQPDGGQPVEPVSSVGAGYAVMVADGPHRSPYRGYLGGDAKPVQAHGRRLFCTP